MGTPEKVLNIHKADLKSSAPTFHKQAIKLLEETAKLQGKLAELGAPWGGDEQGQKFYGHYKKAVGNVEKAVPILVPGLQSIHLAMSDMADGHVDNDDLIAGMFTPPPGHEPPERPVKPEFR